MPQKIRMAGGATDPFDVRWLRLISFHNLEIWRPIIPLTKSVASLAPEIQTTACAAVSLKLNQVPALGVGHCGSKRLCEQQISRRVRSSSDCELIGPRWNVRRVRAVGLENLEGCRIGRPIRGKSL